MSQDDLDPIPSIVPSRDGVPRRGSQRGKGQAERRRGAAASPASTGGRGGQMVGRLFVLLALLVAAGACAWAWQLQQQLQQASAQMSDYADRIGDLEARLSDTDEGMTQNATVQAAKIRELDTEVRKLWDNVWARSKERLDKLEAGSGRHDKALNALQADMQAVNTQLESAAADLAKLRGVAGDLSRLMASAKVNQTEVERVADTLNRIDLELAKLAKRVEGNEEWVRSINAFRGQINASLTDLQNAVRTLQASP
ncbi:MAG: hypothetical protein R3E54_00170 [Halioglobus sp.]